LWRTWPLGRETARDSLDIFHGLSHEIPYGLPRNTRKVVTVHDLIFLRHPELYNRLDVAVYTTKYRSSCHRADRIIAISQQTKRDLVEFFNLDASRIEVVYQSCDNRFYDRVGHDMRQAIRKNHNLPLHYILYVGSLAQRKNVLTLIHALERIPRDSRPHLVLVGTGNRGYMSQLHEAIARADMTGDITWLGQIPGRDLPGIYQMADLFVYPSLFEGFGIPILEALFSKTPVITSTGSCFREAGGPHCLYTPPGDVDELSHAIARVLDDSSLASTMRDKGYEHALNFHEHQVATNMMNVYTSLLA
jgi:glycosyltransferase involved in cell wall biosynthesis